MRRFETKAGIVQVRRAVVGDAEALTELHGIEEVARQLLQVPYQHPSEWQKRLAEPEQGMYMLVAELDGRVVGALGLHTYPTRPRRKHSAGFGICVHPTLGGRGIGSALMEAMIDFADNWLNLVRVELDVYTDNARAIALYERFGFEKEGTRRAAAFRDGEYVDTLLMARISKWPSRHGEEA